MSIFRNGKLVGRRKKLKIKIPTYVNFEQSGGLTFPPDKVKEFVNFLRNSSKEKEKHNG